jgi:hypothetical protein
MTAKLGVGSVAVLTDDLIREGARGFAPTRWTRGGFSPKLGKGKTPLSRWNGCTNEMRDGNAACGGPA